MVVAASSSAPAEQVFCVNRPPLGEFPGYAPEPMSISSISKQPSFEGRTVLQTVPKALTKLKKKIIRADLVNHSRHTIKCRNQIANSRVSNTETILIRAYFFFLTIDKVSAQSFAQVLYIVLNLNLPVYSLTEHSEKTIHNEEPLWRITFPLTAHIHTNLR